MNDSAMHPLEALLRQIAAASPEPWYPSAYARASGVPREQFDPYLDQLRLGGFIRLTDWMPEMGQGCALTPAGQQLLANPRSLARLRDGTLPPAQPEAAAPARRGGRFTTWERGEEARAALLGNAVPVVTNALIAINVVVFLVGMYLAQQGGEPVNVYVSHSTPRVLEMTGAVNAANLYLRHQWWRLLTYCFVHVGILHLGVNMYSLYVIGPLAERIWGSVRFLVLYLLAGICGACAALWESPGGIAGASGAILGILGSLATWLFLHRRVLPPELVSRWRRMLLFNLGLMVVVTYSIPHVSKGGHFGGVIAGIIVALPLDWLRFGSRVQKLCALLALVAIPAASVFAVMWNLDQNRARLLRVQAGLEGEIKDFNENRLPMIVRGSRAAERAFEAAAPVINTDPPQRDAEEVRQTVTRLAQAHTRVSDAIRQLNETESYWLPGVEEARQTALTYLRVWEQLLEACQEYLQAGDKATKQDEAKMTQLRQQLTVAETQWHRLLKE